MLSTITTNWTGFLADTRSRQLDRNWSGSGRRGNESDRGAIVALLPLDYLLTARQIHQTTTATNTHGTIARKTISNNRTTRAETAVRLVSAFASSVIRCQRGRRGIRVLASQDPMVSACWDWSSAHSDWWMPSEQAKRPARPCRRLNCHCNH